MNKNAVIILTIFALFFCYEGIAMTKYSVDDSLINQRKELPYKIKLKYADALYKAGNYYEAMDYYLELTNERPENSYLDYQLGECYYAARDYVTAQKWYGKVINDGSEDGFPLIFYRLAMMQKMNGAYEQAKYNFAKFSLRADDNYREIARREIAACEYASNAVDNPDNFVIFHLDSLVNTPFSEYAPVIYNGELYYSSLNHGYVLNTNQHLSHIYKSQREDSLWNKGKMLPNPINSDGFHSGNCTFSPNGKRMYFTKCEDIGYGEIRCAIYLSVFSDSIWGEPIELSEAVNDIKSNNTHPSVVQGEGSFDILYFSSNRDGGMGGYDIWVSEVNENGIATRPANAGKSINTKEDEKTPFYYDDKLYFSSTGRIGFGGFDIYSVQGSKTTWLTAQNLGYPINSPADDLYYSKGDQAKSFFIVSNREGIYGLKSKTCCDDIFQVYDLSVPKFSVYGKVYGTSDISEQNLIIDAKVSLLDNTSGSLIEITEDYLVGESDYAYEIPWKKIYQVKVQKKGYFPKVITINTAEEAESRDFQRNFVLSKIEKKKAYKLEKIYYEFGKSQLNQDSKYSLDLLKEMMIDNPRIVIEVSAHTDSVGSVSYNLDLSQKRAQACVDYLKNKGVKSKRLIAKGYGQTIPVAPNSNPDGTDNEEGRSLNRRTEIKVIGELSRQGDKIIYD